MYSMLLLTHLHKTVVQQLRILVQQLNSSITSSTAIGTAAGTLTIAA